MLRLITCQHATLLVEQRADHAVPRPERASLWLHLRYCYHCNRYAKQSVLIAEWARAAGAARTNSGPALPDAAKQRMRERLTAAG